MNTMQDVVIKVLTDANFRDALIASPEQTLTSVGIAPDNDLVATLRGIDAQSLKALAETFTGDGVFGATCSCDCTCTCTC